MKDFESGIERRAETIERNDGIARTANAAGATFLELVRDPTLRGSLTEERRAAIFSGLGLLGEPAQSSDPADHY